MSRRLTVKGVRVLEPDRYLQLAEVARKFLATGSGSVEYFEVYLMAGQRLGQAFFNALNERHQEMIRGNHRVDPFYQDSLIPETIRYFREHRE
jgi:hypothetical protein